MDDRVGTLSLRVTTDIVGRDTELRELAERFTREVIQYVSTELETRFPARVVLLQRLPIQWTLPERAGTSSERLHDEIRRAAEAVLERVGTLLPRDDEESDGDAEIAVFPSEPAWLAASLVARARGRVAWCHRRALADDVIVRLASDRSLAVAVLGVLARRDMVAEVLSGERPAQVSRLADVVCGPPRLPARHTEPAQLAAAAAIAERVAHLETCAPALLRLVSYAHALVALETDHGRDTSHTHDSTRDRVGALAEHAISLVASTGSRGERRWGTDLDEVEDVRPLPPDLAGALRDLVTDHAGLFYLLSPILELGLAETLWEACLPEGTIIARSLRALIDADDPALAVIGGEPSAVPAIDDLQARDIAAAAVGALASIMPRGGRAELPPGHARFVEHATGRLLVVTAHGAPFVLFACPAPQPDAASLALASLLARWPATTPLLGEPAVIELDRTGRLRRGIAVPGPPPLLVDGATAAEVSASSVTVGAPCQLVVSRIGDAIASPTAWAAERLARPGRIVRGADYVDVWQPSDAVDLDVRRAGVDRDPGWVPWLRQTIRLHFED